MRTRDAPSHRRFSTFRCEEAVVIDSNRRTCTISVETKNTAKRVDDISPLSPYHHYERGEGIHHLPEVGAICMIGFPSDNTAPFVMGYRPAASVQSSESTSPEGSDVSGAPVDQSVSFQSRRPAMNPGDIMLMTRDQNFIFLRRGGVLQIGASPIAQRIYVPVLNYIRDVAENYRMDTFGGDVAWTVGRQEDDPSGDAPASYVFHLNTYAQDAKATVRVRHMALAEPGASSRAAWEVVVAPNNIDRETGEVSDEVYSLSITTDGEYTEFVGEARSVTVTGDDTLDVQGGRTTTISGDDEVSAQNISMIASQKAVVAGAQVLLSSSSASIPSVKGTTLVELLSSLQVVDGTGNVSTPSPAWLAQVSRILSNKVFLE